MATNRQTAVNTNGTVVWTTAATEMSMLISGVIVTGTSGTMTIRSGSNLIIG
jgi:hypothetical protein